VVALTGDAPAHAVDRGHPAVCDLLLIKPALPDRVVSEVEQALAGANHGIIE